MSEPSLSLALGSGAASVRLQCRPGLEDELRSLALRFRSTHQIAPSIVDIELDDLISNLRNLGQWRHPDVTWAPELSSLVSGSVRDAEAVAARLASGEDQAAASEVADLDVLLGPEWVAGLTAFQRRDISKLLGLRHGANFSVPGAGKTRVGLAVFQALRNTQGIERLLIVGPKSCYESWQYENAACLATPLRMDVLDGAPDPSADAIIVNYERLATSVSGLSHWLDAKPSMLVESRIVV